LGELTIVREGEAVTGLYFPGHRYAADRVTFGPRADIGFEEVTSQLDRYFAGRQANFSVELDPHGDDFQHTVWDLVKKVPYGSTTTAGAIAATIGGSVTAREVGAVVARNPVCILIPCHRAIGGDGSLTGFAGGLTRKRAYSISSRPRSPTSERRSRVSISLPSGPVSTRTLRYERIATNQ
jgi:methylated-DNA-[protein]-cysteine S-methyltransferase